jgi:hypothetical protein
MNHWSWDMPIFKVLRISLLTLVLASSDPSLVLVPPTVTIPGGQTSVSFPVATVDNLAVDGARDGHLDLGFETALQAVDLSAVDDGDLDRLVLPRESIERAGLVSAMPAGLAAALAKLQIAGPLNMQGALEITVPHAADQPPAVGWDLNLDMERSWTLPI